MHKEGMREPKRLEIYKGQFEGAERENMVN